MMLPGERKGKMSHIFFRKELESLSELMQMGDRTGRRCFPCIMINI